MLDDSPHGRFAPTDMGLHQGRFAPLTHIIIRIDVFQRKFLSLHLRGVSNTSTKSQIGPNGPWPLDEFPLVIIFKALGKEVPRSDKKIKNNTRINSARAPCSGAMLSKIAHRRVGHVIVNGWLVFRFGGPGSIWEDQFANHITSAFSKLNYGRVKCPLTLDKA